MWTERLPHPLQTGDPGRVTVFLREIWGERGSPYPFLKETFETWCLVAIYRACAKQPCIISFNRHTVLWERGHYCPHLQKGH